MKDGIQLIDCEAGDTVCVNRTDDRNVIRVSLYRRGNLVFDAPFQTGAENTTPTVSNQELKDTLLDALKLACAMEAVRLLHRRQEGQVNP